MSQHCPSYQPMIQPPSITYESALLASIASLTLVVSLMAFVIVKLANNDKDMSGSPRLSPRHSPRFSPRISPRLSPRLSPQSFTLDDLELRGDKNWSRLPDDALGCMLMFVASDLRALRNAELTCSSFRSASRIERGVWTMICDLLEQGDGGAHGRRGTFPSWVQQSGLILPWVLAKEIMTSMRKCQVCGKEATVAGNTERSCHRHPGYFVNFGMWDRNWSCCAETYQDVPGCEVNFHQFPPLGEFSFMGKTWDANMANHSEPAPSNNMGELTYLTNGGTGYDSETVDSSDSEEDPSEQGQRRFFNGCDLQLDEHDVHAWINENMRR